VRDIEAYFEDRSDDDPEAAALLAETRALVAKAEGTDA
jgi:hypothetical protein